MSARCVRPDCDLPAAFRLAANFGDRIGWLCDLEQEPNPHDYLLCARHAEGLTLPINWELHDQRSSRLAAVRSPAPPPPTSGEQDPVFHEEAAIEEPVHEEPVIEGPAAAGFEYDPASELDESTPLLSRAFRAAMPGDARR